MRKTILAAVLSISFITAPAHAFAGLLVYDAYESNHSFCNKGRFDQGIARIEKSYYMTFMSACLGSLRETTDSASEFTFAWKETREQAMRICNLYSAKRLAGSAAAGAALGLSEPMLTYGGMLHSTQDFNSCMREELR